MTDDEKYFDLDRERESHIVRLNQIIGTIQLLKKKLKDDTEGQQLAGLIYENAWELKEQLQGSLKLFVRDLPEGIEPINFGKTLNEAFEAVKLIEKIDYDFFQITNEYKGVFFGREWAIWQLTELITLLFLKHTPESILFQINVRITNQRKMGVVCIFSSRNVKFPQEVLNSFQAKKENPQTESIIKLTGCMKGKVNLGTATLEGQILKIFLPNYSPE
mgnify:CR=1 FL=1